MYVRMYLYMLYVECLLISTRYVHTFALFSDLIRALVQEESLSNGPLSRPELSSTSSTTLVDGTRSAQKMKRAKTPPTFADKRVMGHSQDHMLDGRPGSRQDSLGFKRPSSCEYLVILSVWNVVLAYSMYVHA